LRQRRPRPRPPWPPLIARPLIILCAPRSGSTLVFERRGRVVPTGTPSAAATARSRVSLR
jgi:hypothetical protein